MLRLEFMLDEWLYNAKSQRGKESKVFSEQCSEAVPLILRPFDPLRFFSNETLELESSDELNVALSADVIWIDKPEAAVEFTRGIARDGSGGIAGCRAGQVQPIEEIEHLQAEFKRHLLFNWNAASKVHAFLYRTLPAIIVEETC